MNATEVNISRDHVRKLLATASPDAAMVYLYISCGNRIEEAEQCLKMGSGRISCAVATLRQLGLWEEPKKTVVRWQPMAAMAACLCIAFTGVWQLMLLSMGTVLIQINPQIRLSVNRMERVISAEALNADGAKVLFDYHPFGKTVEQATGELSDRAAAMGYLTEGGEVHLTVDSQNAEWKAETERRLETVTVHDAQRITIIIEHDDLEDLIEDLIDPEDPDDDWDDDWEDRDDDPDDDEEDDDDDDSDDDDDDDDPDDDDDD